MSNIPSSTKIRSLHNFAIGNNLSKDAFKMMFRKNTLLCSLLSVQFREKLDP